MDTIRNPYAPGAGNRPPELAGREDILEMARTTLGRIARARAAQSLILVGLRGVGKTVLLTEIRRIAEEDGYFPIMIEAHEGKSLPAMIVPPLKELLSGLSQMEKAKELGRKGLRVLRGFVGSLSVTLDGITYGLSVDPEPGVADSGDLEADLPSLLEVVGLAARAAGRPIVLLVDELQYLKIEEFSALIMAIHRINQRQLPLVVVGAGLPQTLALAGNSKSYAERLFRYPEVGPLDPDDARRAIVAPAREEGASVSNGALDAILDATQRYPYFLQQWGYEAWNCATDDLIDTSDIDEASEAALQELDASFFKVRFDRCTPSEKRYMRALASLGSGVHRSSDVAEVLSVKVTSLGPVRNKLIQKGMIYSPAHGDTAFTVPLFDGFMKRAIPSSDPSDW